MSKADKSAVRSFMPDTDFVGYPWGRDAGPVHFRAGVMSPPVPIAWIESLSDKKTASDKAPKASKA